MRRAMLAFGWGLVTVPMLAACGSSGAPVQQEGQRSATGAAGAAGAAVRAEPQPPAGPRPVNLLTATPAVVAVSSTVANREIVPAHLVDGDLGTAWNSRTGELQGAWIGARVPADARVTSIRMTVGFTKVSATGLTDILTHESTSNVDYDAHIEHTERCRLAPPTPQTFVAPLLVLTCEHTERPTQGAGRSTTTPRTVRYSWNGSRYQQQ